MKKLFLCFSTFCMFCNVKAQLNSLTYGSNAPDFSVEDLEGNKHVKKDYEGKYLLVNLYANWSEPCQKQEKLISEFTTKYNCHNSHTKILSIDLNGNIQETKSFKTELNNQENSIISGLNGNGSSFHEAYSVDAYPTYFIIGPDGLIKTIDIPNVTDIKDFEKTLVEIGANLQASQCNSTDIEELKTITINLYPNPSNGNFNYEFQNFKNETMTINVLTLVGQIVYTKKISSSKGKNTETINLSNLVSGSYTFNIIDSEGNIYSQPLQIKL